MDLAWRYPVIVQVVTEHKYDVFLGYVPDFGITIREVVDPGNVSQEYMFHLKLRRMIGERLSVQKAEQKEFPPIRSASSLTYGPTPNAEDMGNYKSSETVSTSLAAKMLGVHPDTIRNLFDSGVLKGSITKGGQRMVLLTSIEEEEARMVNRAELRKLTLRSKKKNVKRRQRRVQKQREEKMERFKENMAELAKPI